MRDDNLDGGLFEAFKTPAGESILEAIQRIHGAGSSLLLRDTKEGSSPVLLRREDAGVARTDSRYHVLGEIARGGIGVVYKGRDKDLNREIALKVLREEYAGNPEVVQRFIEEAQVGGQLQHPGIVPIYGIGLQPDGRPCFAMKLIKGETLAELFDNNPERVDLLAVFEQIAQTMAYAHSRGVIHRDLKPANVMVGAFGEVQVVDWGFAKILGQEELAPRAGQTVIATVRSEAEGSQSIAGSVMGTPAYMPPEQAMGNIADLDERSDVFALGAILCEILTGRPPYTGETKDQLIAAMQSRLEEAYERLDAAAAAPELKQLVRDCLAPLMKNRPRSARVVADRVSEHLASVEDRARQSELDALAAETRAAQERRDRRRALALAGVALIGVMLTGGGYLLWKEERDDRVEHAAPLIASAMLDATAREGEGDWPAAVSAARRAVGLAASEGVDGGESRSLLARIEAARAAAENTRRAREEDDAFLARLEDIRGRRGERSLLDGGRTSVQDDRATDAAYAEAFEQRFGSLGASAERLMESPHAAAYAANLGFWCWVRKTRLNETNWEEINDLARRIDPTNADVRDAIIGGTAEQLIEITRTRAADLPLALSAQVGMALIDNHRQADVALEFLEGQATRAPDDFWVRMRTSYAATQCKRWGIAVAHAESCLALRPQNTIATEMLASALSGAGDRDSVVELRRNALRLAPDSAELLKSLGGSLSNAGRYEEAIAVLRRAVEIDPDLCSAHQYLAITFGKSGDIAAAVVAARRSIELQPRTARAHSTLAHALFLNGDQEEAVRAYRRALELAPRNAIIHHDLGTTLAQAGDLDDALKHLRRALELKPDIRHAHVNLGQVLWDLGDLEGAQAAFRHALELDPENAIAHAQLGVMLCDHGDLDEGIAELRRSIELLPTRSQTHFRLGWALWEKGRARDAIDSYNRVLKLDPDRVDAHHNIGLALEKLGEFDGALMAMQRALDLEPDSAIRYLNLGRILEKSGDYERAIAALERAIALDPDLAKAHNSLGITRYRLRDYAGAVVAFARNVELRPENAEAHQNLAFALDQTGEFGQALAAIRRTLKLKPDYPGAAALESRLARRADLAERLPDALSGKSIPGDWKEASEMAYIALFHRREHAGAVRLYQRAFELNPARANDPANHDRYNAACAAAKAGKEYRAQAILWLRADLALWEKRVDREGALVAGNLSHWKADSDLDSLRDDKQLWADVDALLARARKASK